MARLDLVVSQKSYYAFTATTNAMFSDQVRHARLPTAGLAEAC